MPKGNTNVQNVISHWEKTWQSSQTFFIPSNPEHKTWERRKCLSRPLNVTKIRVTRIHLASRNCPKQSPRPFVRDLFQVNQSWMYHMYGPFPYNTPAPVEQPHKGVSHFGKRKADKEGRIRCCLAWPRGCQKQSKLFQNLGNTYPFFPSVTARLLRMQPVAVP